MRLILSRKGFDTGAGGCASPIFPDGSMVTLPIPDKRSPIRYCDIQWRGRDLGELVARLTKGRQRSDYRAHLDPDIRYDAVERLTGWCPTLGQLGAAQGHLRNQGVGAGDLFLFWGLFRRVDAELRWAGPKEHHVWGWMQIDRVVNVDRDVRGGRPEWQWTASHPHLHFEPDPSNTLYVGAEQLSLPAIANGACPGYGTFATATTARRLTAAGARSPLEWSLPIDFLPGERPPLTFHPDADRWSSTEAGTLLTAASPGQEFVLDLDVYPGVAEWVRGLITGGEAS